jgi:O-antigen/teichoic acid export membrane protein
MVAPLSPPPEDAEPAVGRRQVLAGISWKALSAIVLQGTNIVTTFILLRILSPDEFGLAAMVLVLSSVILLFADVGLGAALIQRETIDERDRSTAFWISASIGLALTLAVFLGAGLVADAYGQPKVEPLLRVFSVEFVLAALGTTQSSLLMRAMRFRALELRSIVAALVGAATAIVIAALGGGTWALIGQGLASTGLSTALLWTSSPWRPHLLFARERVRALASVGGSVFGTRLAGYVGQNADTLIVARALGATSLGIYGIAYNITVVPATRMAGPVQAVLFPAFARIRDPEEVGRAWLRATRAVSAVAVPALLGLVVVAPDFIAVFAPGDEWEPAVPILQILAWNGLLQAITGLNASVLIGLGHSGRLFRFTLASTVVLVGAFLIGTHWGLKGVAVCYAVAATLIYPAYVRMTARATGLTLAAVGRSLAGTAAISVVMAAAVGAVHYGLVRLGLPAGLRLGIEIAAGLALYTFLAVTLVPDLRAELHAWRRRGDAAPA